MVGLDQLLGLLHADVRLLRVVFVDDLDRQAAELAAEVVETELERIAHVVADGRGRAAERADEADFDGFLLRRCVLNHARAAASASAVAAKTPILIIACIPLIAAPVGRGGVSCC